MINREAGYGKCPGAPTTSKKLSLVISRIKGMGFNSQKIIFAKERNKSAFISPLFVSDVSKHDHCK